MNEYVDIVFDGPPSHESGRFIEVEDATGASIRLGEWIERPDGCWALRIPDPRPTRRQEVARLAGEHGRMAAAGVPGEVVT